jgi:hypothetical protein
MPVLKVGMNRYRILVQIITIEDEPIKGSCAQNTFSLANGSERRA